MNSAIHQKHSKSLDRIVSALQATPPRTRSALTELRRVFERSGEHPPAILAACAAMLATDKPTTADVLHAVRTATAEWDSYSDRERDLFRQCVYTSQTRRDVAVTSATDVVTMLRENPPRIAHALDALRWLNAATQGEHRETFTACANLLKNPSATHPTVVDAIHTGHRLWPTLTDDHRALLMTCVYASKERAAAARERVAAREKANEEATGDVHRCANCDGSLADTPELTYCSDACRRNAESTTRPTRIPAERRAQQRYVRGAIENQYDEQYREIVRAIPSAGTVRKDERVVDHYEDERHRVNDRDTDRNRTTDLTGRPVTDDDYDRQALRAIAAAALCSACNLERTPIEQRTHTGDDRCEMCRERNTPPLRTLAPAPAPELIAA